MTGRRSKSAAKRAEDLEALIGSDSPVPIEELMPGLQHYAELKVCCTPQQAYHTETAADPDVTRFVTKSKVWVYELGRSVDGEFQAQTVVTRDPQACQDLLMHAQTMRELAHRANEHDPPMLMMLILTRYGPDPLDTERVIEWMSINESGRIDAVADKLSDQEWLDAIAKHSKAFVEACSFTREIEMATFYTPYTGMDLTSVYDSNLWRRRGQVNSIEILRFDVLVVATKDQLGDIEDVVEQKRSGFGKVYRRSIPLGQSGQQQIVLAMFSARASKRATASIGNLLRSNARVLAQMHGAAVLMRSIHWNWHMWHGLEPADQGEMEIWNNNELVYLDRQARKHCLNEEHVSDDVFNHPLLIFVDEALDNVTVLDRSQRDGPAMRSEEMTTRIEKFLLQ